MMKPNSLSMTHLIQPLSSASEGNPPALLMLHGIGSNENDLFAFARYVDLRLFVISIRAPLTLGYGSYGWFNLGMTPQGFDYNAEEVLTSRQMLNQFIDEAIRAYSLDTERIYLAGFSQGAVMSLDQALVYPEKVAGVIAMSGCLLPDTLKDLKTPDALNDLPILMTHGIHDPVLPVNLAQIAKQQLSAFPVSLTYHEYPMAHQVSEQNLNDVRHWLSERLDS